MSDKTKRFLADLGERAGKTFAQFYLGSWLLAAGLLNTDFDTPNAGAYDLLFTLNNVKAGVVGVALSVATSIGAKKLGAGDSASLLPADVDPIGRSFTNTVDSAGKPWPVKKAAKKAPKG